MVDVIRKWARILAILTFFIVFGFDCLVTLLSGTAVITLGCFLRPLFAASLLWIAAIIAGDILFKGIIENYEPSDFDTIEGGLLQQVVEAQKRLSPEFEYLQQEQQGE